MIYVLQLFFQCQFPSYIPILILPLSYICESLDLLHDLLSAVQYQFYSLYICYSYFRSPRIPHYRRATVSALRPSFQSTDNLLQQSFQFQCRSSVLNFINATGRIARAGERRRVRKRNRDLIESRSREHYRSKLREIACVIYGGGR